MPTIEFNLENVKDINQAFNIFNMTKNIIIANELPIHDFGMSYDPDTKKENYIFGLESRDFSIVEKYDDCIRDIESLENKYKGIKLSWREYTI